MTEMKKMAMIVAYDGTRYYGFQRQSTLPTIQERLEEALFRLHQRKTGVTGAGRTDARVHATGQVIHFMTDLRIPPERWPYALQAFLPEDIQIRAAYPVEDSFHARYSAVGKRYRYRIDRGKMRNLFTRNYALHYPYPLEIDKIKEASSFLLGRHDFSAFAASGSSVKNHIRTLYDIQVVEVGDELQFTFWGDGFLYNMVRILVGTLLEVGGGRRDVKEIVKLLRSGDRTKAGITVPPHGLTLEEVLYPEGTFRLKT
ncbi:tRNA pseudouridine synthase A [[Clostridium] ultunense Esp]|nr:tRNA pseudouridine synthase A [[Clostridium] ultunense Esp]